MDYIDLLNCEEWRKLRHELVAKIARYCCSQCRRIFQYWDLQIHHKIYVRGRRPWHYDQEDLLVVCFACHCTLHKRPIPIFDENENWLCNKTYEVKDCEKCEGNGYLENLKGHPDYYDGICFDCQGTGTTIDAVGISKELMSKEKQCDEPGLALYSPPPSRKPPASAGY